MNLKKKRRVVMLPTEKSNIGSTNDFVNGTSDTRLVYSSSELKENILHQVHPMALYILSDDKIEEGDWAKCYGKKIIATTDKSIGKYIDGNNPYIGEFIGVNLPQPSPQFIQKFIEEWNKGNKIEWVNVEYEENTCNAISDTDDSGSSSFSHPIELKIDKNNYITITKIEKDYRGFCEELFDIEIHGLPINTSLLRELADKYNVPIPGSKDWISDNL